MIRTIAVFIVFALVASPIEAGEKIYTVEAVQRLIDDNIALRKEIDELEYKLKVVRGGTGTDGLNTQWWQTVIKRLNHVEALADMALLGLRMCGMRTRMLVPIRLGQPSVTDKRTDDERITEYWRNIDRRVAAKELYPPWPACPKSIEK